MDEILPSPATYDQNQPRQRLRSWLSEQLDTKNCPGCEWIDNDIRMFKLAWKHYGRPGFDEERDAKIFREWARHTKRYTTGDPSDVSTWKTRFRNALHKMPDIEEMASLHQLDGNDPYRVYRFRTPTEMERIKNVTTTASVCPYGMSPAPPSSMYQDESSQMNDCFNSTSKIDEIKQYLMQKEDEVSAPPTPMDLHCRTWNDDDLEEIERILMKAAISNNNMHFNVAPVGQSAMINSYQADNNIPITAIGIKLYLSEKEVGCEIFNNLKGVRIAYEPPLAVPPEIVKEDSAKEVLSDIYGPLDALQMYYPNSEDPNTKRTLNWIRRGLVIENKPNGDIYATRLCQAKVFYSDNILGDTKALVRSQPTLIFSFYNGFLPSLEAYKNARAGTTSFEMYFSFAQKWSVHEPLKEVFVHCSVTHFLSQKLFKDARAKKPVEELISVPNYQDYLKETMEKIVLSDVRP